MRRLFSPILLLIIAYSATVECREILRLATTTSTAESGLLDLLTAQFEKDRGIAVQVIAVGSGKALKLGEGGDVDILLVHSPAEEERFIAAGHGIDRRPVMHIDLIIVGPAADPATVHGTADAAAALKKIAGSAAPFISRGDDSGTHAAERRLWQAAGILPDPKKFRYIEAGQGMSAVLRMADELTGYTLADRATYEKLRPTLTLQILVEGDPRLFNRYSVITVNPKKYPKVRHVAARTFTDWLTGPAGRAVISKFAVGGRAVFFLDGGK